MNEDYISNQIAVYKNSKTLIEFQDKLKIASVCSTPTSMQMGNQMRMADAGIP